MKYEKINEETIEKVETVEKITRYNISFLKARKEELEKELKEIDEVLKNK